MAEAENQNQVPKNAVVDEFLSSDVAPELTYARKNAIYMMKTETENRLLKTKLEKAYYRIDLLEKEIRQIREIKGRIDAQNNSVRSLVQGYLIDGSLNREKEVTEQQFKNILRVLDPSELNDPTNTRISSSLKTLNINSADRATSSVATSSTALKNSIIPTKERKLESISVKKVVTAPITKIPRISPTKNVQRTSSKTKILKNLTKNFSVKITRCDLPQTKAVVSQKVLSTSLSQTPVDAGCKTIQPPPVTKIIANSARKNVSSLQQSPFDNLHVTSARVAAPSVDPKTITPFNKLDRQKPGKIVSNQSKIKQKRNSSTVSKEENNPKRVRRSRTDKFSESAEKKKVKKAGSRQHQSNAKTFGKKTSLFLRTALDEIRKTAENGEEAMKFVNIIAVLHSSQVSYQFLQSLYHMVEGCELKEAVFNLLKSFSVIELDEVSEMISFDPQLQKIIREELEEDEFSQILSRILDGTLKMLKNKKIPYSKIQMVHVNYIWKLASNTPKLILKEAKLSGPVCNKLFTSGNFSDLYEFSCALLNALKLTYGENCRWTLETEFWKGRALTELGKYEESLELLSQVHEKQKNFFRNDEDDNCLWTANCIGNVNSRLKRYEEALKWYRDSLEKMEVAYGVEHSNTLTTKHNIAKVLKEQGKYKEAIEIHEQILEIKKRVKGISHPETLTTKHNLATVIFKRGKPQKALYMFQKVLEARQKVLGENHPDTLITKSWIVDTEKSLARKVINQLANEDVIVLS